MQILCAYRNARIDKFELFWVFTLKRAVMLSVAICLFISGMTRGGGARKKTGTRQNSQEWTGFVRGWWSSTDLWLFKINRI